MTYTVKDFINFIRNDIQVLSFDEFLSKGGLEKLWEKQCKNNDIRCHVFTDKIQFYRYLYRMALNNTILEVFYNNYFSPQYPNIKDIKVENNIIYNYSKGSNFYRNINMKDILNSHTKGHRTLKDIYYRCLHDGKNISFLTSPSQVQHKDSADFQYFIKFIIKTEAGIVSIFNPSVYYSIVKYIINNYILSARVDMLAPTASWGVPITVAGLISTIRRLDIVDVQASVLNTCANLYNFEKKLYGGKHNNFIYNLYGIRSEQMSTKLLQEYNLIFFCPPYYNLESYNSENTLYYNSYTEWLKLYWERTCINSFQVLKSNGIFSFVVSNKVMKYNLADDLLAIAKKYFSFVSEIKILPIRTKRISMKYTSRYER